MPFIIRNLRAASLLQNRLSRGSFVVEVLGVITILAAIGSALLYQANESNDERLAEIAGVYHRRIETGAQDYVKAHYSELLAAMPTEGATKSVTFATLRSEGYVPDTLAATNPWGQAPTLRLRRGAGTDKIEGLVIGEGGDALTNKLARLVARAIGAQGGYTVSAGDYCGTTKAGTNLLCGTQGVWTRPVTDFGANNSPGHVASALFFLDGMAVSDYLYRKHVPGKPELNTMETYLQLGTGAVAVEGQPCYSVAGDPSSLLLKNGAIGTTASGMILSCQSGVWSGPEKTVVMSGNVYTENCDSWMWWDQRICYYSPYVTVTFDEPMPTPPHVVATPATMFPYTPCAQGAADAIDHSIANVTRYGFTLYGGASPATESPCNYQVPNSASGRSVSLYSWIAIAQK